MDVLSSEIKTTFPYLFFVTYIPVSVNYNTVQLYIHPLSKQALESSVHDAIT